MPRKKSAMNTALEEMASRSYFFDKGIRFECLKCGGCCNGEPGVIYVSETEITDIAEYTLIERDIFVERCLYLIEESYSIKETDDGRCIFYENGCSIYPVRPLQCSTFPFWFQNMRSEESWESALLRCPGIGKGPLFSKEAILERVGLSYPIYEALVKDHVLD
jgi:Fe-S-cluster containining protein